MQSEMGDGAASNTDSKQPVEGTALKPKLQGSTRPQAGQDQQHEVKHEVKQDPKQEQEKLQGQVPQGTYTKMPYVPSLAMLGTLPAGTFPGFLDTNSVLDFDSKEVWKAFNALLPTESFSPITNINSGAGYHQQAGATVQDLFDPNYQIPFDPAIAATGAAVALDPSTLPQNKSHLAAEFKLKHSKKADDKNALVQYDQWAEENGVNDLVANRIAAKEQKKAPKRQRAVPSEQTKKKTRKDIKSEPGNDLEDQLINDPLQSNANTWHLHTPRDTSLDDPYHTPVNNRFLNLFSDSPQSSSYIKQETSRSGTEVVDATLPPEATDPASAELSATKLKGTVYPGMSIFDAATKEQRRKRNQKKHSSVLKNMVLTSESVEQFECVWGEDMSEITRTRNVYDSPSIDGSPGDNEDVPSTGKKRRGRRAVAATTGPRRPTRQTRASTRATSGKVGKRRGAAPKKQTQKVDDGIDTDNDASTPLSANGQSFLGGDVGQLNDASIEDDVFQDRSQGRRSIAGVHIASHPFSHPTAMQALPTNMPLNMSSSIFDKATLPSYYEGFGLKENDSMAFPLQQSVAMPSYFVPQGHNMQQNGFNPLCVQRHDNFPFIYGSATFDGSKPSTPAFQPMNGSDYGGLGSAAPFQAGKTQHETFDI